MTPHDFVTKWRSSELKERSGSQSHFNDLCALLGVADPATADSSGEWFTFEKGVEKTTGGSGWADVWRKDHFAWEYKGRHANLDKALQQLLRYSRNLDNPPLLIVSDMDRIQVHTNFTNSVAEVHEFTLDDLRDGKMRDRLKQAFIDPEAFKPTKTVQMLTEEVAREFATLAQRLRDRGHDATTVAHFVVRCAFCMFAEDVDLLPNKMFERLVLESRRKPDDFAELASDLFRLMSTGGRLGLERVAWFNGGLFDDDAVLPLNGDDIDLLHAACKQHWGEIDPSILGTLFERGLDPDKRSQLGAHYTDRAKIELIVGPTIAAPLTAEWLALLGQATVAVETAEAAAAEVREKAATHGELKAEVRALEGALKRGAQADLFPDAPRQKLVRELDALAKEVRAATDSVRAARAEVKGVRDGFMAKLRAFRVLDPACGSGNFLYVALKLLKDIEHRVNTDAEALGVPLVTPEVGPANVLGIELNPFAAELARTSVWIGDIQWMRKNGFEPSRDPVLKSLDTIECRDAVLAWVPALPSSSPSSSPRPPSRGPAIAAEESGIPDQVRDDGQGEQRMIPVRAEWPVADVVVGNPPFLGGKKLIAEMGKKYADELREAYTGQLPGFADLVCYWFSQSIAQMANGKLGAFGLVATNSIRGGKNREVLRTIPSVGAIFDAWSDEPWVVDGASVRVSIINVTNKPIVSAQLNGKCVAEVHPDLTAKSATTSNDITLASKLSENADMAFIGVQPSGPFSVGGDVARSWLLAPVNPNGISNSAVLAPYWNGMDITRRPRNVWIVDPGANISENDFALFERPFQHVLEFVRPQRLASSVKKSAETWWQHWCPRPEMRKALTPFSRYVVTARVAKYRLFAWAPAVLLADCQAIAIARDDDTSFGILHSKFHELWSLRMGTFLGVGNDPRYTPSTTFETFPFPLGLTPNIPAADYAADPRAQAIATAAARLNELRENWLNPADLVVREPEVVPGYPDRILPKDEAAAKELKQRTLTNLYNARPQWLANAHTALDEAVADAYGWGDDWRAGALTDDEILARLFRLNQERAGG